MCPIDHIVPPPHDEQVCCTCPPSSSAIQLQARIPQGFMLIAYVPIFSLSPAPVFFLIVVFAEGRASPLLPPQIVPSNLGGLQRLPHHSPNGSKPCFPRVVRPLLEKFFSLGLNLCLIRLNRRRGVYFASPAPPVAESPNGRGQCGE